MNEIDRSKCEARLKESENYLGLCDGFKFVYGPWKTLSGLDTAFLSLNPGRAPDGAELRTISDERGNSYEIEKYSTKSPITDQFLRLTILIGKKPGEVLTGVVAPFRSDDWDGMTNEQKKRSLILGEQFWREPLQNPALKLIFVCSNEAANVAIKVTDAIPKPEIPAGWGKIKIRRYLTPDRRVIVHLPHLSRFRLLGRSQSEKQILLAVNGM